MTNNSNFLRSGVGQSSLHCRKNLGSWSIGLRGETHERKGPGLNLLCLSETKSGVHKYGMADSGEERWAQRRRDNEGINDKRYAEEYLMTQIIH